MNSCLLYLFGEESDLMTDDEVSEDVIRERKDFIHHISRSKDDYGGEVVVRQIMTFSLARKNMYKESGITKYGDKYQEASSTAQVSSIAKELAKSQVYTYDVEVNSARLTCDGKDGELLYVPKVAWAEGKKKILSGIPISK